MNNWSSKIDVLVANFQYKGIVNLLELTYVSNEHFNNQRNDIFGSIFENAIDEKIKAFGEKCKNAKNKEKERYVLPDTELLSIPEFQRIINEIYIKISVL